MTRFLIVGASGTVGSGVVQALVRRNAAVRAVTSNRERVRTEDGVEWVHADLGSGAGVREAFADVDRAFFFAPPGYVPQDRVVVPLIEEALRRGLQKVALMTALGANAVESAPLRQAELALERSGLAWNVVRPNWFMQNFNTNWLHGIRMQGKILLPAGTAKVSFIDTRDISAAVARLLAGDDLANRAFDLTGPRALDLAEAAAILSRAGGRTITYQEIEPDALRQGLLAAGLPAAYADFLVLILGFLKAGHSAPVTGGVRELLGREPTSFEQYAQDHRPYWAAAPAG
jgi:uncharacterized protein YbjT (DUF2867 family)